MPITPFHLGPGALVKSIVPRCFSFTVFAISQAFSQGLPAWQASRFGDGAR